MTWSVVRVCVADPQSLLCTSCGTLTDRVALLAHSRLATSMPNDPRSRRYACDDCVDRGRASGRITP